MQRHYGIPRATDETNPILTLGMFDGVHLGHQAVLHATVDLARRRQQPSVAITFDIHPRQLFGRPPAMVTSLDHRLQLLEQYGIDMACILPFNAELAAMKAIDFVRTIFIGKLHVSAVVLGYRAHFGAGREGDCAYLQAHAAEFGFETMEVPAVLLEGEEVSSTAIREAVADGDLKKASGMLGRPVSLMGTVIPGRAVGRSLGFPTINLDPHHELRPPRGVYATRTRCGDTTWDSVTNIGYRPTFDAQTDNDMVAETFLLDFSGNLYGQTVEVRFFEKLRDERRFGSQNELVRQIHADVADTQAILSALPHPQP